MAVNQDITRFESTIQGHVKHGKVGQEVSPELGINRSKVSERAQFNSLLLEEVGVQVLFHLIQNQKSRGPEMDAEVHEELGSAGLYPQLRLPDQFRVNLEKTHEVADNHQIQVQQPLKAR
jgi:hypothetical protein